MKKAVLIAAAVALFAYGATITVLYVRARQSAIRGWLAARGTRMDTGANKAFRASLRLNAGIGPADTEREIVDKLTNLLYQHANFGGPFQDTRNSALRYVWNLHGANREYCSTLSSTLKWALGLFDIPARIVNIAADSFTDGKALGDTHTLVEVRAGRKTFLTDPTFDTHYHCGDAADIDAKAMNKCVLSGRKLSWTYIGNPRPGRKLSDYYLPIKALAVNMDASDNPEEFYTYERPAPGWLDDARRQYDGDG